MQIVAAHQYFEGVRLLSFSYLGKKRRHKVAILYSCGFPAFLTSDFARIGEKALISLRVRLEGFASYSPFSVAMP